MVVAAGSVIEASELGLSPVTSHPASEGDPLVSLEEIERRHIATVLQETGGNISHAARVLGIDRATLYNKMRKFQLKRDGDSDTDSAGEAEEP
jgi:transcriptional regulator of acetoin/glycerol metabolism